MNEHNWRWRLRLTALALLVVCGSLTAMLAKHRSSQAVLGPYSVPAAIALVLAIATSAAALAVAVLPQRQLGRLANWLGEGVQSFRIPIHPGTRRNGVMILSLAVASYVVIGFRFVQLNAAPHDDQLDYLVKAAEIRRIGGLTELSRQLFNGTFEENQVDAGNRHPLYTALLSLHPEFGTAKCLSFLLGLLTLGVFSWTTVRRFGWMIGGLGAALLATNSVFQQSASIVACEMLLVLCTLLAWFTIERPPSKVQGTSPLPAGPSTNAEGVGPGNKTTQTWLGQLSTHPNRCALQSALVGVWLGLAYLTKASAVFLLLGFLVWSLSVRGLRRCSWVAVISFVVISSPMLVRNTRALGNPLYSFNTRFLFADSFEQGLNRPFRGTWTEATEYWSTHSTRSIVHRAATGLAWEGFIFLRSLAPATLGDSRPLVGLVVVLLASLGLIQADRQSTLLAAVWCAMFYLFFAWYVPIASGDRFLAPIVPIVLLYAARGVTILIASRFPTSPDRITRTIWYAALLWCFVATILSFKSR